ncbi:MAG: sigma-70 family RNA polymerase sigma factor [Candidatus Nomurabacteria bacterium]|nr:MAG: sigma-70 family RNA polymerase sigma factor [Candidatus Nomurabacteria bacterium]
MNQFDTDPSINMAPTTDTETTKPADISFEELYANYYTKLTLLAKSFRVRDPEATAQEAFIKAYEHYDSYVDMGYSRYTWLCRILRNTANSELRKSKLRPLDKVSRDADILEHYNLPDAHALEDFKDIELDEIMDRVYQVISPKSPNWYEIFTKRVLDNDKCREISEDLEIPMGTVQASLFRACKLLAEDEEIRAALGK